MRSRGRRTGREPPRGCARGNRARRPSYYAPYRLIGKETGMDALATVERMYAAANGRDLDALPEIFAPDFCSHPLRQRGVDPIRAAWRTIFDNFPDFRVTPQRMFASGDRVAVWSVI